MQKQIHLAPQTAEEDAYTPSSAISTREFKILRKRVAEDKAQLLAQITVNADQIQLMASKTYVDGIKANLEASITVNADAIALKASQSELNSLGDRVTTAESTLTIQADAIATKVSTTDLNTTLTNYSTITQTSTAISTYVGANVYTKDEINTTLGSYSTITQTAASIATRVATTDYNGNTIASLINQTATTIAISASKINLTGYVTMTNLETAGQTTINGDNITTGTLSADRIYGGTINGTNVNITNLNASNINAGSMSVDRLTAGSVSGWYFGANTISRGQITLGNDYIRLEGYGTSDATINFYNTRYGTTTRIYAYDQSGAMGFDATVVRYTGGITVEGNIYTYGTTSVRNVYPTTTNSYNLGSSTLRWATIWQTSGSVVGSDRRLKDNIKVIDKGVDLILNLKPVEYTYKGGTRTHYGLIAQEVKETMNEVGIEDAGVYIDPIVKPDWDITNPEENDQDHYLALRYDELIAPMIQTIQYLNEKIKVLEDVRTL